MAATPVRQVEFTPEWGADVQTCYRRGLGPWGLRIADAYDALIRQAVRELIEDPDRLGVTKRPDLGNSVRVWPLAASKQAASSGAVVRNPSHYVVFLLLPGHPERLIFLRLLRGAGLVPRLLPRIG